MGGSLRKPGYLDNDWFIVGVTRGSYFTGTATPETGDEDIYIYSRVIML